MLQCTRRLCVFIGRVERDREDGNRDKEKEEEMEKTEKRKRGTRRARRAWTGSIPGMAPSGTKSFDNWMNTFLRNSMLNSKNSMQQLRVGSTHGHDLVSSNALEA